MFIAIAQRSQTNTISISMAMTITITITTDLILDGLVALILRPYYMQGDFAAMEAKVLN